MDFDTHLKVIVVGNGGVGKTSMATRYCKNVFTNSYKKTIGVDFMEKIIERDDGRTVHFLVWDTAGQEEFDALTRSYYSGASVCAFVFSTTDRASFEAIERWVRKVKDNSHCAVFALVQNKVDLLAEAAMTPEEVDALGRKLNMPVFRTCVKDNVNVEELFEHLGSVYILGGGDTSAVGAMTAVGDYGVAAQASAPAAAAAAVGGQASTSASAQALAPASADASSSTAVAPKSSLAAPSTEGVAAPSLPSSAPAGGPPGGAATASESGSSGGVPSSAAAATAAPAPSTANSAGGEGGGGLSSASATNAPPPARPPVVPGGAFKLTLPDPAKPAKKRSWC